MGVEGGREEAAGPEEGQGPRVSQVGRRECPTD